MVDMTNRALSNNFHHGCPKNKKYLHPVPGISIIGAILNQIFVGVYDVKFIFV